LGHSFVAFCFGGKKSAMRLTDHPNSTIAAKFFFLQKFESKKIFLPVTVVVFDVHLYLDLILKCPYIFKNSLNQQ